MAFRRCRNAAAFTRFWRVVEQKRRLAFFETSMNTRSQSLAAHVPRRSPCPIPIILAIPSAQIAVHIGTSAASTG